VHGLIDLFEMLVSILAQEADTGKLRRVRLAVAPAHFSRSRAEIAQCSPGFQNRLRSLAWALLMQPALRATQNASGTIPAPPGTRLKNTAYQQAAFTSLALAEYCFIFNIF